MRNPFILALLLITLLATGRSGAQSHGLTSRPEVGPYLDGVMPPTPPVVATNWSTVVAFPNLTFVNALGLLPVPGTDKLVVWEREGRMYSFVNNPATTSKTLALDLSNRCQGWDDEGLLAVAFHPAFATNHHIYLWYNWVTPGTVLGNPTTRPPNGTNTRQRLARFTMDPSTGIVDPASEYIIIDQIDHNTWHNGGGMMFHPTDGFLYLTNGNDASAANDQSISNALFGCLIRIDVDKRGGAISHPPVKRSFEEVGPNWPNAYHVPNDNPFVGVPGALEEIFALGLRSPHRMTHDATTNRIFIGDVGEGAFEEVHVIEPSDPAGLNFQWNRIEGYNGDLVAPYIGVNRRPIIDYPHSEGSAVIGGYVYRGSEFPELVGKYVFGDNVTNRIWLLDESSYTPTTKAKKILIATMPFGPGPSSGANYTGLSSFGLDAAGELYLCQMSSVAGKIYKLARGGPPPGTPLPATLSQTGVFSNMAALTPSPKLIPYALNQPFWSDGAVKSRWATVPTGTTVGFNATGEWTWPAGSVLVKHFELPVDDNNPAVHKRLETRLLVKTAAGPVYGATYKWRADNSDADLMDSAITENIPVAITPVGALAGADIGSPGLAGATTRTGDELTVSGSGADIWGNSDQFHFASQQRTGDFDISVRVSSLTQPDLYTKVGLMARENLTAGSRHVYAMVFPSNAARNNNVGGYEYQYRTVAGGPSAAIYPASPQPTVNYPNTWLRMKREGDTFTGYSSVDGVTWSEFARLTLDLPDTLYFGLAATSHNNSALTTAKVVLQNVRMQPWYYPSRTDCMTCHNDNAGGVLGPKTRQLNGDFHYPGGVVDNQLRSWGHVGLFDNPPPETQLPDLDALAAAGDTNASLEKRARSYLDSNCSSCHRPGGVHAFWDARFDTPLAQQGIIYGNLANNLGDPRARVVMPQDVTHSVLHRRMNTIGGGIQMPPLAKNVIDRAGVELLAEWINSLTPNIPPIVALTSPATSRLYLASQPIQLAATASDADGISKVEFYDGGTKIGEDATPPYQFTWTGALRGGHSVAALALDTVGNTALSTAVDITVQGPPLPAPWQHADIGTVGVAGDATYDSGTFTLSASGDDIWGTRDSFHFIYRPFTGDGEVIARVADVENVDGWTKSGVMMRNSLAADSTAAFTAITPGNGAAFQRRKTTAGDSVHTAGANVDAPYWVRLVRAGTTFSAYSSPNGVAWSLIGSDTITMGTTIYAGLALTSHNNSTLAESNFDSVSFINTNSPAYLAKINFQPATATVPAGYLADSGSTYGLRSSGFSYGWSNPASPVEYDSVNAPDQRYDTVIPIAGGSSWEIQVPNARYKVRVVAGDPTYTSGTQTEHITVEGQTLLNASISNGTRFADASNTFNVTDGRLTIATGANAVNTKICFIEITSYDVISNIAPALAISSPSDGGIFYQPASVPIEVIAEDVDTAITKVEFFIDGIRIGEDTTEPYSHLWTGPVYGTHSLTARATDIAGGVGESQSVGVTVNTAGVAGLRGEYYNSTNLTDLVSVRADAAVNFDWGNANPVAGVNADNFSVRWSGKITPRYSESHVFRTNTDDGVRLWVDGRLIIDHWGPQAATSWTGTIALVANQSYDIVMEYYEGGGNASAKLYWSSASQIEEIIPSSRMTVPPPQNLPPAIVLTSPSTGAAVFSTDEVTLAASATDPDGTMNRVEFWADGKMLGQVAAPPYTWNWAGGLKTGTHTVWAVAYDGGGASTTSAVVEVESLPFVVHQLSVQHLSNPDRVAFTLGTTVPAGRGYSIEWSENLIDWTPLRSEIATGSPIEVTDTATGADRRFYRMGITR
ncbi:PQQ-dependent sugar dehydrogenase [Luteolibacter yonseiensis]|uniref:PQQ-dependent sugar dehydrogenase n=1 Tax=Luteolibacter yonseiensis TaxID=1144680 RepID=A0A934VDG6_9BACT|nr:Ig-like domain-containing protein [Luteolibacter yonseiensis]MBK1818001.1 PQQ-dependent sugar dehydrogenase [Luteolibacter yonseiensis]